MSNSKKNSTKLWKNISMAATLFCVVCVVILLIFYYRQQKGANVYRALQKEVVMEFPDTFMPETEIEDGGEIPKPQKTIDFEALMERNPEVYAWIEILGTQVSYPVLQHEDGSEDYYLKHTIDHEETLPGAIYSERSSAKDFSDFAHILYGHNMRNGTMFAGLHQYEDADFLAEHPYIYIYTPEKTYTYEVFAAVVHSDKHLAYEYDLVTEDGQQKYLDDMMESTDSRNQYHETIEVTTDSRLLVLSTCVFGESDKRYLVNAVLVKES